MALTELAAFETAYQVLAPLDEPARRRALQWLSDALAGTRPLVAKPANSRSDTAAASAKPATRRRRGPASTDTRSRKPKGASAPAVAGSGREYRRMPEPDEVITAYRRIGTVSGLAEHFGVPQHTATHWARRLRSLGYQIGRTT